MKIIVIYSFLLLILYKSVEPAIIYLSFLEANDQALSLPIEESEKIGINHHADLDVEVLPQTDDLNVTLSGKRISKEIFDDYNEKMKDFFNQENQRNKHNSFAGFDQLQNYLCPDHSIDLVNFYSNNSAKTWVYAHKWQNICTTILSPPPQV